MMDFLVTRYKVLSYIEEDPIQIPHRYVANVLACELVAFVTALFSYGRRERIISGMDAVFRAVGPDPVGFVESFSAKRDARLFRGFVHRFNTADDLVFLWERLKWAYGEYGSLEGLFLNSLPAGDLPDNAAMPAERLQAGIAGFTERLLGENPPERYGLKFLLAHPGRGGACKRFNMFLRWMVRQDEGERVDFGLWRKALRPRDLRVPLDTHVLNMNRRLGLTARKDGSWKTAEAITAVFRGWCPEDPVKYDYALFGFSLERSKADGNADAESRYNEDIRKLALLSEGR
jgi:uncharacterized protein (TIGR02757 family)